MNTVARSTINLPETIEKLQAMPDFVLAAIAAVGRDGTRLRLEPGDFCLIEHACHLRDLEREGYLVRVRRLLAEPRPALEPFDGAAVAASRDYMAQDARMAGMEFAAARKELLGLLAPLTDAELSRPGTFGDKPVTLGEVIAMAVAHDREHRAEIEALLDRVED
jgi:hypothetical protein